MRVAVVTPGFPPDRGGVEAHVAGLVAGLAESDVDVEVFTSRRGVRHSHLARSGDALVHVYPAWRLPSMSVSPRLLWAAVRLGKRFDVVHVHSYHASSGTAALVGLRSPVVFTPHYHGVGHTPAAQVMHRFYRHIGAALFRLSRAVICVSRAEKALLVHDFPWTNGKVSVVPNGTDTQRLRSARPFSDQPPTVLSVGRLEQYKRIDELIDAMREVPAPAQLVIVGEGSARAALVERVRCSGLAERVHFTGNVDDETVRRWMRTARVLVSLSEHEAFGMAPVEAVGAGARVVLSNIPAHRELEQDHLGDAARIVSRTCEIAPTIDALLALGSPVRVQVPDWTAVASSTLSVYRSVCKQ